MLFLIFMVYNFGAMRRNIILFSILLGGLFVVSLIGLIWGLADVNRDYRVNKESIDLLVDEIKTIKQEMNRQTVKLDNYDFMEFKVTAFSKRFSLFSHILDTVYVKSHEYGFKPQLVLGMIQVESGFNPKAISTKEAYGLMQVNLPVWRRELGIQDHKIFDVEYNVDLGLKILKHYYDESGGNLKRALHLYNNGYLYNNTSYTGKVDSAVLAFQPQPVKFKLTRAASTLY